MAKLAFSAPLGNLPRQMRAHVAIHLEQWFLDYVRPFINGDAESEVLPKDAIVQAEVAAAVQHVRVRR